MIFIVLIAMLILMAFSVFFRTIILNPHFAIYYAPVDLYHFIKHKLYNQMETGRLICYTALFGGGKTLSCVHFVCSLYRRYNNKRIFDASRKKWVVQKVHIISNVELNIPYEKFESLNQIVEAAEKNREFDEKHNTRTCTLVLGDEFSVQMNCRNFKTNIDAEFLNTLLTCRHHHIMLIYNAQRFQHVDKLLRGVTTYCVECKKIWRVCIQKTYDAWTIENCADPTVIKPIARHGWFIRDKDFKAYDTLACVDNLIHSVKTGDMIPEEEILSNRGDVNIDLTEGDFRRLLTHKRFGNLKR